MKQIAKSHVISIGLAIFSMLFGAGNLIYPLMVGQESGKLVFFGMLGFLLTSVILPIAGIVGMILFDGDYQTFFKRVGELPGELIVGICVLIIGPVIAIPRITTLSHIMIAPFIPITFLQQLTPVSSFVFALIFLGITFAATFRESKIIDVLGKYISPVLLLSLTIIIIWGLVTAEQAVPTFNTALNLFKSNLLRGYETLDLLGTIFFASIVISILKKSVSKDYNVNKLAIIGCKAGLLGVSLLGLVYIGMSLLGVFHAHNIAYTNAGELFREIAFRILGTGGAAVIATAVLMACLSTSIALSAVVAEYVQKMLGNKINFITALAATLLACIPLSTFGLKKVLVLTGGPIVYIGYPIIIVITFCN
ncbi:MAG: branched-chain amino acid transport system II carrier protein, partial [Candidatus Babeliales bacterium]